MNRTDCDDCATVLITGAGTATCQSVIKGLRAQNEFEVRIVTVDMTGENAGRYLSDYFQRVPPAEADDFLPTLLRICEEQSVDLLVPIVDYEFDKLARASDRFEAIGCRTAISSPDVIRICNDKWQTYHFLRGLGVPTPTTWLAEDVVLDEMEYPVFVKPRYMGRGSIDAYPAVSAGELQRLLRIVKEPIIQTFQHGAEHTVDVLCDFAGTAINGVVRRRTETKSGVSTKGVTVSNDAALAMAVQIAEALPILGPANLQFFAREEDICFIEINPRFSGTLALSIAAGFNSPHLLLRLLRRRAVVPGVGDYQTGVQMFRYWQEVFVSPELQQHTTHSELTVVR